jgi:hypothetical protein
MVETGEWMIEPRHNATWEARAGMCSRRSGEAQECTSDQRGDCGGVKPSAHRAVMLTRFSGIYSRMRICRSTVEA